MPRATLVYGAALGLSLVTLFLSYLPFVWLLIRYQTWRLGHSSLLSENAVGQDLHETPRSSRFCFSFEFRATLDAIWRLDWLGSRSSTAKICAGCREGKE